MGIRGRDGIALEDHWADGPKTFLGVQTTGFPNFFFPGGPHAAAGNNPRYNGDQVDFVTDTLVYVRDHGYDTIEVEPEAEERWTDMVDTVAATALVREEQLLLREQHPRQAAQVPLERRRPPEALQGDRTSRRPPTTKRSGSRVRPPRRDTTRYGASERPRPGRAPPEMIDEFAKEYLHNDLRDARATMLWKLEGLARVRRSPPADSYRDQSPRV